MWSCDWVHLSDRNFTRDFEVFAFHLQLHLNLWWLHSHFNSFVVANSYYNYHWTTCCKLNTIIITSDTRDLRTPVATPLQPPWTCSGPDRCCAGIRTSCVYPHVINPGIYSFTRHEKTQNPKPRFWHFEPWFPKVLKISENTFLYITVGSFDSARGRGRFLYPPMVRWEKDAIQPSFLSFGRL